MKSLNEMLGKIRPSLLSYFAQFCHGVNSTVDSEESMALDQVGYCPTFPFLNDSNLHFTK